MSLRLASIFDFLVGDDKVLELGVGNDNDLRAPQRKKVETSQSLGKNGEDQQDTKT